jgi:O-antigen ligase
LSSIFILTLFAFSIYQTDRAMGFMAHPNDLAIVSVLTPFVSSLLWPIVATLAIWSGSRNAVLGLVVAIFFVSPRAIKQIIGIGIVVGLLGLMVMQSDSLSRGGTSRAGQWWVAVEMFKESPLFGKGPYTFVDHYLSYIDYAPAWVDREIAFIPWAHNIYLEQLAERGLVGLGVFLVPLVMAWVRGSKQIRASLAAFLVMGIFDLTLLKPWVVGAYWGLVGIATWTPSAGLTSSRGEWAYWQ